jgi:hypothetical protein
MFFAWYCGLWAEPQWRRVLTLWRCIPCSVTKNVCSLPSKTMLGTRRRMILVVIEGKWRLRKTGRKNNAVPT